jgi:hypothetical protein
MMGGFDYFDGNHRENFSAALILLCLDEDSSFRQRFADLVRKNLDLPTSVQLSDWGREASLITEQGKLRSDLWLNFDTEFFLIEVKTHSKWPPAQVVQQILRQKASQNRPIRDVALLAPTPLLRSIQSEQVRKLHWREVLDLFDTIEHPSQVLNLAQDQWRSNVEPDFGLARTTTKVSAESMQQLVSQAGCLRGFLQAALNRLGGKISDRDKLYLSGPVGQPTRWNGYKYHQLAIPGSIAEVGSVRIGIYKYVSYPDNRDPNQVFSMWLEMNPEDRGKEPVFTPFDPPDLSYESLDEALDRFLKVFNDKYRQK